MKVVLSIILALSTSMVSGQAPPQAPTSGVFDALWPEFLSIAETCAPDLFELISSIGSNNTIGSNNQTDASMVAFWNQYFTSLAQDACDDSQKSAMEAAFVNFKTCSGGLDMLAFIGYLPSAMVGAGMECFLSMAAKGDVFSNETFTNGEEVISDSCLEAMLGSNVMGDMLRTAIIKPDELFPCFEDLADDVPSCTYSIWPMPIVGKWLKSASCLVGSAIPLMEMLCKAELTTLNTCIDLSDADLCSNAREQCIQAPSISMLLPPKMLGVPLMDTCIRVSQDNADLEAGVSKYNGFVEQCVNVWEGYDKAISSEPPEIPSTGSSTAETQQDSSSASFAGARFLVGLIGLGLALTI